jgi:hypothetical protein
MAGIRITLPLALGGGQGAFGKGFKNQIAGPGAVF